jgi:nitrate reductase NapAB chaperone NapD
MNENLEELKKELQGIKKNVEIMKKEEKINTMQDSLENIKYQRKNNIFISGIPVSEQEDVYDIVFQLAGVLNVELVYGDIDVAHRLPAKQGNRHQS